VLARALVLEADPAEPVGQRKQEGVAVEMAWAEYRKRFLDQLAERDEVLGLRREQPRLVGDDADAHRVAEIPLVGVGPGEDRRIDQRLVVDGVPGHPVALLPLPVERGEHGPALREGYRRRHPDLA